MSINPRKLISIWHKEYFYYLCLHVSVIFYLFIAKWFHLISQFVINWIIVNFRIFQPLLRVNQCEFSFHVPIGYDYEYQLQVSKLFFHKFLEGPYVFIFLFYLTYFFSFINLNQLNLLRFLHHHLDDYNSTVNLLYNHRQFLYSQSYTK
jgi:hypothetical protein